ncbi:MAG: hypothetical protein KDA58_02465 [Planctomycetaceae bacterium]|nr:hypothetical protein [Planctomycetaceae bacterium]
MSQILTHNQIANDDFTGAESVWCEYTEYTDWEVCKEWLDCTQPAEFPTTS